MKKFIIVSVIIIVILVANICFIMPYLNISNICKLINNGETEKAIKKISTIDDVNHYSAPLLIRKLYNIVGNDIELPLVTACYNGDYEVVECLLEKGADPNKYLENNWTPIEATFVNNTENRVDIAEKLISYGARVDLRGSGQSALFLELSSLIYSETIDENERSIITESVLLLLDNGASPTDDKRNSIFHYLAFAEEIKLLETLSDEYENLIDFKNQKGETPLMWAVKNNSVNSVECLLDLGADVNIEDNNGKTAYDYAISCENSEIIMLLKNNIRSENI